MRFICCRDNKQVDANQVLVGVDTGCETGSDRDKSLIAALAPCQDCRCHAKHASLDTQQRRPAIQTMPIAMKPNVKHSTNNNSNQKVRCLIVLRGDGFIDRMSFSMEDTTAVDDDTGMTGTVVQEALEISMLVDMDRRDSRTLSLSVFGGSSCGTLMATHRLFDVNDCGDDDNDDDENGVTCRSSPGSSLHTIALVLCCCSCFWCCTGCCCRSLCWLGVTRRRCCDSVDRDRTTGDDWVVSGISLERTARLSSLPFVVDDTCDEMC